MSTAISIYVLVSRDETSIRENMEKDGKVDQRIAMRDFVLYRYQDARLKTMISARTGALYEPNRVELTGEVRGFRDRTDKVETMGSEMATGYFSSRKLSDMMSKDAKLSTGELSGFVEFGLQKHLLTTDYALFEQKKNLLQTNFPVRMEGPNRVMTSDSGFIYNLDQESLKFPGEVKGIVSPNVN